MQDRYVGDVGDFGKLGLLRELEHCGFTVGVNWYKAVPEAERDREGNYINQDGKHRIRPEYFPCDELLAKVLIAIFESKNRSIDKLENSGLLDHAVYYGQTVRVEDRSNWHRDALAVLAACDLVFLDPDNGLIVKSIGKHSEKSVKYVFEDELSDYLRRGQSVVLYNHRPRKKFDAYLDEFRSRFAVIDGAEEKHITVMSFHKGTTRDFFLIAANEDHARAIDAATEQMIKGAWGGDLQLFTKSHLWKGDQTK